MNRYSRFYSLLKEAGAGVEEKTMWIRQVSQGRTASIKELTTLELHELEKVAKNANGNKPLTPKPPKGNPDDVKMVRKVFALCHDIGWELAGGKIDYNKLNAFLRSKHCCVDPKRVQDYSREELIRLINQLEGLAKYKAIDAGGKALENLKHEMGW